MDYDLCGKNLYHAEYQLKNCEHKSQRYIICSDIQTARVEIESYDVLKFSVKVVQEDISIVVI